MFSMFIYVAMLVNLYSYYKLKLLHAPEFNSFYYIKND